MLKCSFFTEIVDARAWRERMHGCSFLTEIVDARAWWKERTRKETEKKNKRKSIRSLVSRYTHYMHLSIHFIFTFIVLNTLLYSHIIYLFTFHIVLLFTQIHFSQLAEVRAICHAMARNGFLGYSQDPPSERQPLLGNSGHRPASVNHLGIVAPDTRAPTSKNHNLNIFELNTHGFCLSPSSIPAEKFRQLFFYSYFSLARGKKRILFCLFLFSVG
jgi:hypothetical protein